MFAGLVCRAGSRRASAEASPPAVRFATLQLTLDRHETVAARAVALMDRFLRRTAILVAPNPDRKEPIFICVGRRTRTSLRCGPQSRVKPTRVADDHLPQTDR